VKLVHLIGFIIKKNAYISRRKIIYEGGNKMTNLNLKGNTILIKVVLWTR